MVARKGRLADGDAGTPFQDEEFPRSVEIPAEHSRPFPAYYRVAGSRLKIAVSVAIARKRIDLEQGGHFYYPLKTPASRTGCAISVSAPFELSVTVRSDKPIDGIGLKASVLGQGPHFSRNH